jgi:RHS repeat-associated protein
LTRITVPSAIDFGYTFSATQNNGRVTKMNNYMNGEEVNYSYDALNRLIAAYTTGSTYGLSFTYDGFGNKTAQSLTKGSAPVHSFAVDGSTNRIIGVNYDANGNQNGTAGWAYDVLNRLKAYNTSEYYGYLPSNKRVWHRASSYVEKVYYYDITGQRIGEYQVNYNNGSLKMIKLKENYYFAGKLIRSGDEAVAMDRLSSVRWRKNLTTQVVTSFDYYPYGEEKPSATANERDKFATYMRDATGLDYADQRYFNSTWGRFVTADPFADGMNWYTYVGNDPINHFDPSGLAGCIYMSPMADTPNDACPPGYLWDTSVSTPDLIRDHNSTDLQLDPAEAWAQYMLGGGNGISTIGVEIDDGVIQYRSDCEIIYGSVGAANVYGYLNPGAVLHDILRNGYKHLPTGYQATAKWGDLGGPDAAVFGQGGDVTLVLDRVKFRAEHNDIFGIRPQAGIATEYVYQGMILLHELGHIYNLLGNGFLGGSAINDNDDGNRANQARNQALIFNECASAIFNKKKVSPLDLLLP